MRTMYFVMAAALSSRVRIDPLTSRDELRSTQSTPTDHPILGVTDSELPTPVFTKVRGARVRRPPPSLDASRRTPRTARRVPPFFSAPPPRPASTTMFVSRTIEEAPMPDPTPRFGIGVSNAVRD